MAEEQGNPYGQLIAKAWTDEEFKARLLADPKAAMKEVGMDVPEGMEVEVVESTQEKAYLVIPAKPGPGELSDEDLDKVAGGIGYVNFTSYVIETPLGRNAVAGGCRAALRGFCINPSKFFKPEKSK